MKKRSLIAIGSAAMFLAVPLVTLATTTYSCDTMHGRAREFCMNPNAYSRSGTNMSASMDDSSSSRMMDSSMSANASVRASTFVSLSSQMREQRMACLETFRKTLRDIVMDRRDWLRENASNKNNKVMMKEFAQRVRDARKSLMKSTWAKGACTRFSSSSTSSSTTSSSSSVSSSSSFMSSSSMSSSSMSSSSSSMSSSSSTSSSSSSSSTAGF